MYYSRVKFQVAHLLIKQISIGTLLLKLQVEFGLANSKKTKMNKYELKWIIKDKSVQKDENTERQKDNIPKFKWTKMN